MSWGSRLAALPPAAPGQESAGGHRWAQVGEGDRKPRGAGGTHPLRVSGAQVGERSCEHSLPGQGGRRLQSNHADVSSLSRYQHRTRGSRQRSTLPRYLHTSILRQEDLLEEGVAAHSRTLACTIPMAGGAWPAMVRGVAESQMRLSEAQHSILTPEPPHPGSSFRNEGSIPPAAGRVTSVRPAAALFWKSRSWDRVEMALGSNPAALAVAVWWVV